MSVDETAVSEEYKDNFECEIYYLSDLDLLHKEIGVVIALTGTAYEDCINNLINKGIVNII